MQRPSSGEQAREGRQISFVVSDGIVNRLMPDLRYQSLREVQLDLSRSRLRIGKVTYAKSDIVPEAHVVSQNPAPLTDVDDGDSVDLVVSRGGLSALQVPTFTGLTIDDARDLATRSGIKLGQIVWTPLGPTGPPHGAVVRQIPAPNSRSHRSSRSRCRLALVRSNRATCYGRYDCSCPCRRPKTPPVRSRSTCA